MNVYAIPPLFVDLMILIIGVYVLLNNIRSNKNQLFFFFCLSMCVWLTFFSLMYLSNNEANALFFARLGFIGIIFIPIFAFHFVSILVGRAVDRRILFLLYAFSVFSIPFGFSSLAYYKVKRFFWRYYPLAGSAYVLFLLMFACLFLFSVIFLFQKYQLCVRGKDGYKLQQIKYVLLAFLFGLTGLVDYIIKYNLSVYPFGYISAYFLIFFMAYAIVRHQLMNITLIIKKTLIYSLVVAIFTGLYLSFVYFFSNYFDVFVRNFSFNMNFLSVPPLLSAIFAFVLGIFVFSKKLHSRVNQVFALLCFETFYWQMCWFVSYFLQGSTAKDLIVRIAFSVIVFIPFTYYHFAILFLNLDPKKHYVKLSYLFGFIFLFLIWFSDLFIAGFRDFWWGYYPWAGQLFFVYLIGVFFFMLRALYLILYRIRQPEFSEDEKTKVKFLAFAHSLYFFASIEFLIDYGIPLYPIAVFLFMIIFSVITYAILKHHLMDIVVVIKETLIYSLMITVFTALYLVLVFVLGQSFQDFIGASSAIISIFLLILFSFLFQPLKVYIQNYIEKRFFRERYLLKSYLEDLSKKVISIIDLGELLDLTARSLHEIFKAQYIAVFLFDKKAKTYRAKSSYPKEIFASISDNFYFVAKAKEEKTILLIDELPENSEVRKELKKLETSLVIPLISKDNLIGLILVGENKSEIGKEELSLLLNLSSHLSIAIENGLLMEEKLETQKQLLQTDKLKSLGTIAAGMAHEIKNPLTVINNLAKLVKKRAQEGDQEFLDEFDAIVPRQLERIKKIAEGLSQYGKKNKPEKRMINLNKILEDVIRLFEAKCRDNNIEIQKNLKNLPLMQADPEQMTQVFTNLILNAIEAMEGQGSLKIKSRVTDDNKIEITISDTGHGIPKDKLKDIFEPFYTTKEQGSGLGLSIVKKIVEEHGGKIDIESNFGVGTTFMLSF